METFSATGTLFPLIVRPEFEATGAFWWQVFFLGVLILLSGFFSGSEIGLFRLSHSKRKHLLDEGEDPAARTVDRLLRKPDRTLITILIGNNLVNILAAALATSLALDVFGSHGVAIATGVMTLLILTFGEIMPKAYASRFSAKVSLRSAPPLRLLQILLFPLVWLFEGFTRVVFRLFGAREKAEATFASTEEIRTLIEMGEEEGVLEEEERDMLHGVIDFGELMAKEVMVPRQDMICLPARAHVRDAVELAVRSGRSRLPVFDGGLDNIVGTVYVKDLLAQLASNKGDAYVTEIMRDAVFMPETNTLDDVLRELQRRRTHMAIVVDEYGGTSGLVTMEDLLEEIVGEIFDEYDRGRETIRRVSEDTVVVDARVHVDDVNEEFGTSIPEDEVYETVGGFVYHSLERIPHEGESFEAHGLAVKVEKVANRRILRVRLQKISANGGEPSAPTGNGRRQSETAQDGY
jgi:putative hemolysin